MRKNYTFNVVDVNNRNDFIDKLEDAQPVIRLDLKSIREVAKQITDEKAGIDKLELQNLGIIAGGTVAFFTIPIVGPLLGMGSIVGSQIKATHEKENREFDDYEVFRTEEDEANDKLLIINFEKYNPAYDTIEGYENMIFVNKSKCPCCGEKISRKHVENNKVFCGKCGRKLVMAVKE